MTNNAVRSPEAPDEIDFASFLRGIEMFKKNLLSSAVLAASLAFGVMQAQATPFTSTSPTNNFNVTTVGASTIGGVVMDLFGLNGAHVISQLAASSLFVGFASSNPFTIGTQTGLSSAVLGALGGGLQAVAFRFTLFDGDTGPGDFDDNQNTLLVNGINFGNWSDVVTQRTDNSGNLINQNNAGGFRDNLLDTGWFHSQDASKLSNFFTSISTTQKAKFELYDTDPRDNNFDFRQGINTSLVNVGQAPVVTPPANGNIPEPATLALLGVGLAGLGLTRRRRRA